MRIRRIAVPVVFAMLAAACSSDGESTTTPVPDVTEAPVTTVIDEIDDGLSESAAVSKFASTQVFLDSGWTIGDDGMLHPPEIEYLDGVTPEDLRITFVFTNSSGYNLDIATVAVNDNGSDTGSLTFDPGDTVMLSAPFNGDDKVGFVLTSPNSGSTYKFAGDRGGAPCNDRLDKLEGGQVVSVEFQPTDDWTLGFPGVLTEANGDYCTFGMLTDFQTLLVEHPVLAVVTAVLAVGVVVLAAFKGGRSVRSLRARAAAGREIVEISEFTRLRPQVLAADMEAVRLEREVLKEARALVGEAEDEFYALKRIELEKINGFTEEERLLSNREFVEAFGSDEMLAERTEAVNGGFTAMVGMELDTKFGAELSEDILKFSAERVKAQKSMGLIEVQGMELSTEQWMDQFTAYFNQQKVAEVAKGYAKAEPQVYNEVMRTAGDRILYEGYLNAEFGAVEWEEIYQATAEALGY